MNRRSLLVAAPALAAAPLAAHAARPGAAPVLTANAAQASVERYFAFGNKRSGGAGDLAAAAWKERALQGLGYRTERQTVRVPFFETEIATLQLGGRAPLTVLPQAPALATPAEGISARLVNWNGVAEARGAIAVVTPPFRRWSAFRAPDIERPVRAALAAGAAAVVVVTTGPTGEIVALNADIAARPFPAPVVLIGSREGAALIHAADRGQTARLTVRGEAGERDSDNLVGRLDRGAERWIAVSTPRTGWTACAGERGPGVAIWLALAQWLPRAAPAHNIALLSTTAHEYDNGGGHLALKTLMPKPHETTLWVHLGANIATRDFHDVTPTLVPLPSADPQRLLAASTALLPAVRRAFAGQAGLEVPNDLSGGAEGELKEIVAAGHGAVFGVYGAHRFHHVAGDDMRTIEPGRIVEAASGFQQVIRETLGLRA